MKIGDRVCRMYEHGARDFGYIKDIDSMDKEHPYEVELDNGDIIWPRTAVLKPVIKVRGMP